MPLHSPLAATADAHRCQLAEVLSLKGELKRVGWEMNGAGGAKCAGQNAPDRCGGEAIETGDEEDFVQHASGDEGVGEAGEVGGIERKYMTEKLLARLFRSKERVSLVVFAEKTRLAADGSKMCG